MKLHYGVTYADPVTVSGQRYILERRYVLEHPDEETAGSCPVKLSVAHAGYSGYNWWNVDRQGWVTDHDLSVPRTLADACKIWMTSPGYQDMPLVDFLSSLGVIE